jgi:hypothetical protein
MSSKRHHPHKGGTTPTTEPKDRLGVVQFSVSEVAQFSMSLDIGFHDIVNFKTTGSVEGWSEIRRVYHHMFDFFEFVDQCDGVGCKEETKLCWESVLQ